MAEVPTDILFVLDSSASMSRDDERGQASDPQGLRLSAVRAFITLATARMRIGLVNLSDEYSPDNGMAKPTALQTGLVQRLTDASPQGKTQSLAALAEMKTTHEAELDDGFTYMTKALDLAARVMARSDAQQKYVIVLTDGDVTGEDPRAWWSQARDLQSSGTRVVVFRLGSREPPGLTNDELGDLNEALTPGGGAARVIERPEDLLGYYLQTFVVLNQATYVNALGSFQPSADQPILNVQPWMDVTEIFLLVPTTGTAEAGPIVSRLVSEKLGRDVAPEVRSDLGADQNLEILTLSRERLGSLDGIWRLAAGRASGDVQLVFRSRVEIAPQPLYQPKGAETAVVAVRVQDGGVPIPHKDVSGRGAAGEEAQPLLLGPLGGDRYSGRIRPDREGDYRVRVSGESPPPPGGIPRDLPPRIEKVFAVPTTDKISLADVSLGFERVTQEKMLKAGQALQVRVGNSAGGCHIEGVALRVDADYSSAPTGIPGHEGGAAAQPMGQAPGGGLLYGFVPQAPGRITFGVDHAMVGCPNLELPVGFAADGQTGTQSFDVDIERLLKVDRDTPGAIGTIPLGSDSLEVGIKYEISSYRPERLLLAVQGMTGAAPVTPLVEVPARQGTGRPQPRAGIQPIRVKLPGPMPGGTKGNFVLVVQRPEENGSTTEIARYDFAFEVAPGVLGARMTREPQISRDGVRLTLGFDPRQLLFLPTAESQDVELSVEGLTSAQIEPKIVRLTPRNDIAELSVFVKTAEMCSQVDTFRFKIGARPISSPNGEVLVAGSPIEVGIALPKMEISLAAPERIGALRSGVSLPVTLQSSSLCSESMLLNVDDPDHPARFPDSGLDAPNVSLGASDGGVRVVQLLPERPAARGEGGTLQLSTQRVDGHPSTIYPAPVSIRYYTPLWTEEYPRRALAAFLAILAACTIILSAPRVFLADPIVAHREGDTSLVSGRKRFRWILTSAVLATLVSAVVVYWAMARFLP